MSDDNWVRKNRLLDHPCLCDVPHSLHHAGLLNLSGSSLGDSSGSLSDGISHDCLFNHLGFLDTLSLS